MQLQRNLDRFDAAGISVFAISTDPISAQSAFAEDYGITYPLLSDPDHAVIESVGVLNTLIEPDQPLPVPPGLGDDALDAPLEVRVDVEAAARPIAHGCDDRDLHLNLTWLGL